MKFSLFLVHYVTWHYSGGVASYLSVWRNFLWFAYHFFSIPVLFRTLFSPFQKLNEEYKRTLDLGYIAQVMIVNVLMRLVGAGARSFIILMGLVTLVVIAAVGAALFVVWLMLPLALFTLVLLGLNGLFNR